MVKAAGLFQAFTRNMAYGVKALIDQRIEGGEALVVAEPPAARALQPEPRRAPSPPPSRDRGPDRGSGGADAKQPKNLRPTAVEEEQ